MNTHKHVYTCTLHILFCKPSGCLLYSLGALRESWLTKRIPPSHCQGWASLCPLAFYCVLPLYSLLLVYMYGYVHGIVWIVCWSYLSILCAIHMYMYFYENVHSSVLNLCCLSYIGISLAIVQRVLVDPTTQVRCACAGVGTPYQFLRRALTQYLRTLRQHEHIFPLPYNQTGSRLPVP
jgi:hypothetical protein